MKKFLLLACLLAGYAVAHGQSALFTCSNAQTVTINTLTANSTIVPIPSLGRPASIYICSFGLSVTQGTSAVSYALSSGTGTNCSNNLLYQTEVFTPLASTYMDTARNYTSDSALRLPANNALCYSASGAAAAASLTVRYVIY